jgi:hypothetical protein
LGFFHGFKLIQFSTIDAAHRTLIVHKRHVALSLFRGNSPQSNTFNRKENHRTCQQKLTELQDRVLTPTLKEQDTSTQQPNGGKENIVVAGEARTN